MQNHIKKIVVFVKRMIVRDNLIQSQYHHKSKHIKNMLILTRLFKL
jgi:hypothetical protein